MSKFLKVLTREFEDVTNQELHLPEDYCSQLSQLCEYLEGKEVRSKQERRAQLISRINSKFQINKQKISSIYSTSAKHGISFNYHEKLDIQAAFDISSYTDFKLLIQRKTSDEFVESELLALFDPVSELETLTIFNQEIDKPTKLRRSDSKNDIGLQILLSAFSAFVFSVASEEVMHSYFDKTYTPDLYEESFWLQLKKIYPNLYNRNRALDIVSTGALFNLKGISYNSLRNSLLMQVRESYKSLTNHGYLAIWVSPIIEDGLNKSWELASEAILYAEKHDYVRLEKGYFKHSVISEKTSKYIAKLNLDITNFNLANEGFTYKDTFVFSPSESAHLGEESLLLLFQKNKRDETIIPCPSCRSHNVRGNSYPTIGVKSWECQNILCPDKSKYNRGKRYSYKSLLMQEAINDLKSQIPINFVRSWSRDVQTGKNLQDAIEMLIRHYSLYGDTVTLFDIENNFPSLGRNIVLSELKSSDDNEYSKFYSSSWFHRYIVDKVNYDEPEKREKEISEFKIINGDCFVELHAIPDSFFDGAVTSPPYYNARDYSQWDNIYCYLYDIYNIAMECYRVLKAGAPFIYNIFDYFDNENTVALSAMGKKRLILSALTVDVFKRCGFQLAGSVTWDKGEIEGKRAFNAGNFSPYYQSPFNCWEHILIFYKPPITKGISESLPAVLKAQPVMKMFKGQNTYGHTAPYPFDIPLLLNKIIPEESYILDPFGGSGTTARALYKKHKQIVCIEKEMEYADLAKKLFLEEIKKTLAFESD